MGKNVKKYVPEDPWTKHKRRKREVANMPNGASREPGASYLTQLSILFIRLAPMHEQYRQDLKQNPCFGPWRLPDSISCELQRATLHMTLVPEAACRLQRVSSLFPGPLA